MRCIDCREVMLESERPTFCHTCHGRMHPECAMTGFDDDDLCEECYFKQPTPEYEAEGEA